MGISNIDTFENMISRSDIDTPFGGGYYELKGIQNKDDFGVDTTITRDVFILIQSIDDYAALNKMRRLYQIDGPISELAFENMNSLPNMRSPMTPNLPFW